MPFYGKKMLLRSKVLDRINRMVRICVFFFGMSFLVLGTAGCASEAADEFWIEETGAEETDPAEIDSEKQSSEEVGSESEAEKNGLSAVTEKSETDGPMQQALFVVHICGAVCEPGVYELPQDSRIMDAVNAAGGFSENAASDARNLAERIVDGTRIRIPTIEEYEEELLAAETGMDLSKLEDSAVAGIGDPGNVSASAVGGSEEVLVNINTANAAMLQTLPGIGVSRAEAIIAYREQVGAFSCIEDIMKVSGIKQAAFEKLKSRITV